MSWGGGLPGTPIMQQLRGIAEDVEHADCHTTARATAASPSVSLARPRAQQRVSVWCSECKNLMEEGRRRRSEALQLSSGEGEGEGELLHQGALTAATGVPAGMDIPLLTEKQCMHCMHVKPVHLFRRSKNKTDKLQNRCKVCPSGEDET